MDVTNKRLLTPKQHETYKFIKQYVLRNKGRAPTIREIAEGTNLNSHGVAHRNIQALISAGYIVMKPHKNRSIEIVEELAINYSVLPIIANITAGEPTIPTDKHGVLDVTELLLSENLKVIQVADDSLANHNISEGDYVLCEPRERFNDDELVVAVINNDKLSITYVHQNNDDTVTLLDNPTEPLSTDQVQVQGAYIGLIRMAKQAKEK